MQSNGLVERKKIRAREWKWSLGEPYQRSARFRKSQEQVSEEKEDFNHSVSENQENLE